MKSLHRPDLFGWSAFDPSRNLDFNSVLWRCPDGNIVIDPVALSDHDRAHVEALGGIQWIIVTNSDHVRATREIVAWSGGSVAGPAGESQRFPVEADVWLAGGQLVVPGLTALEMRGSKTPGELALVLEGTTLITGDLVRGPVAGRLDHLPPAKLTDGDQARSSVAALAELPDIEAVLVGDGWSVFHDGAAALRDLVARWST